MSLESLTPDEKKALQESQKAQQLLRALLSDPDPEYRHAAQRLLKKKDPNLQFPELDQVDAVEAAKKVADEKVAAMRAEIAADKAANRRAEEDKKIRDAGYDPEKVRKIADERGVADLDLVVQMLQAKDALAEPSNPSFQPLPAPDLKELWANPDAWLHNKIEEVHREFGGKRSNPLSNFG